MITRIHAMSIARKLPSLVATSACTIIGMLSNPAFAVDTEVFYGQVTEGDAPNILFILDTSKSMFASEKAGAGTYDPLATYVPLNGVASCDESYYYFFAGDVVPGSDPMPCPGKRIPQGRLQCPKVKQSIDRPGGGFAPAVTNAWKAGNNWRSVTSAAYAGADVYCQGEDGLPANIRFPSGPSNNPVTLVSGKYVNFLNSLEPMEGTRIDTVKRVIANFVEASAAAQANVNMGFMRYYWGGSVPTEDYPDCRPVIDPEENDGSALGGIMVLPVHSVQDSAFTFFDRYDGTYKTMSFVEALRYKLFEEQVNHASADQCDVQLFTPGGRSPIAASMYEALLYYGGFNWDSGNTGKIGQSYAYKSVLESMQATDDSTLNNNTLYSSPIVDALCAGRNYIVILSDGTTELDSTADNSIETIGSNNRTSGLKLFPDYNGSSNVGSNNKCTYDALVGNSPSNCLDDVADYLATWGVKPPVKQAVTDANGNTTLVDVPDEHGIVKTYTIGLSLIGSAQEQKARDLLQRTAIRGQGLYYESTSPDDLLQVLNTVLRTILQDAASFTSPTVAVNAFNRTQNLNDLYMSVFEPAFRYRWRGNLKKYRLQPVSDTSTNPPTVTFQIFGTDPNLPAVDESTGFFTKTSQSFWTPDAVIDGDRVTLGGAASQVPAWDGAERKVYTNLATSAAGGWDLADAGNAVSSSNITDAATLGKQAADPWTLQQMVDWLRGRDVVDQNGNGNRDEGRLDMGDPLHGKPAVVIYGGTAELPTGYIFLASNDGFVHAFDTDTGVEKWAFIPANLLGRTRNLMKNDVLDPEVRGYGLDGSIRVLRIDNNNNGLIEPDDADGMRDKVYLFFGQRRGGSSYYGMDVTLPGSPKLMWVKGRTDTGMSELGETWSTPTVARVQIRDADCSNAFRHGNASRSATDCDVLVVGGGYDASTQDAQPSETGAAPYATSTRGRALYMLDAYTGAVRWRAGLNGSGAHLQLPAMLHAIPSDVRVLELTEDGFADRLYVGDLGGQLWRFDIRNGQPPSGSEGQRLVEGGVLADLSGSGDAAARRFFYAPDVSRYSGWLNVAVGSGHREYPNQDVVTQNGFYVVRDRSILGVINQSAYPDPVTVTYDALTTVDLATAGGSVALADPGWKVVFSESGEKVLAESSTFGGIVYFTSYTPRPRESADGCRIGYGVNKLYTVSIVDASRVDRNRDGVIDDADDLVVELEQGGIAPEPVFIFPSGITSATTCIGADCRPKPICLVGLESCGQGLSNRPVRTYWRQRGVVDAVE